MEIETVKDKVSGECMMLGGGLPYDPDSIEAQDWESLADELRDIASHIANSLPRVAGYAGYAQRRANEE